MRNIRMGSVSLGLAALLLTGGAAEARIIITEVLANEVGSAATGEWVELMNIGQQPIDISNYKFGDEETAGGDSETGGMFQFPVNTTLAPGQIIIVAASADRFNEVYGFKPDFETFLDGVTAAINDPEVPDMLPYLNWVNPGEIFNMANSNDQAILLGPDDSIADAASWGNPVAFDPGISTNPGTLDGQSYYRLTLIDTDTAADWAVTPDGGTAATRSTPGVVSVPEPASLTLLSLGALALLRRRRQA